MLTMSCPHCSTTITYCEVAAGQERKCPACQAEVRLAGVAPGAMNEPEDDLSIQPPGAGWIKAARPPPAPQPARPREIVFLVSPAAATPNTPAEALPAVDLTHDPFLQQLPRVIFQGGPRPTLGDISLLSKLGQGGMGAVYCGFSKKLNTRVAVKVLPFHLASYSQVFLERFLREARVAREICSPNLVHVHEVGSEAGIHFQIMEYVHGVTAGQYLAACRLSGAQGLAEREALTICIAAAGGLAAAHAQGVIHRDIKPDNIFIPHAPQGQGFLFEQAKLADLGLARAEGGSDAGLTGSLAMMGTPGYVALEQCRDAKTAWKPADVFSAGATLHTLLAGYPPFRGASPLAIVQAMEQASRAPFHEVRPDLSAQTAMAIERCLLRDPAARYPDGAALKMALDACLHALPPGAGFTAPRNVSLHVSRQPVALKAPVPVRPGSEGAVAAEPVIRGAANRGAGVAPAVCAAPRSLAAAAPAPAPRAVLPTQAPPPVEPNCEAHAAEPAPLPLGRASSRPRGPRLGLLAVGVTCLTALCAATIVWLLSGDNWEGQTYPAFSTLARQAESLQGAGSDAAALEKYDEALKLVDGHELRNAAFADGVARARQARETLAEAARQAQEESVRRQGLERQWDEALEKARAAEARGALQEIPPLLEKLVAQGAAPTDVRQAETQRLLALARGSASQGQAFVGKLEEIDRLLAAGDLAEAKRVGDAARPLCGSAEQRQQLATRIAELAKMTAARAQQAVETACAEGQRALEQKRWADADAAFQRALKAQPDHERAKKGAEDARLGAAREESERLEEGWRAALLRGRQALEQEKWEEAETLFRRALELKPGWPEAMQGLTETQTGRKKQEDQRQAEEATKGLVALAEGGQPAARLELVLQYATGEGAAKNVPEARRFLAAFQSTLEKELAERQKRRTDAWKAAKEAEQQLSRTVTDLAALAADRSACQDRYRYTTMSITVRDQTVAKINEQIAVCERQKLPKVRDSFVKTQTDLAPLLPADYREKWPAWASALTSALAAGGPGAEWLLKAEYALGHMALERGNAEQAAKWLKRAAEKDSPDAAYHLGLAYRDGKTLAKDPALALRYLTRAAKADAQAQYELGCLYADGAAGTQQNAEAVKWWQAATQHPHPAALVKLGQAYADGTGVTKDEGRAKACWETAAAHDYLPAVQCLVRLNRRSLSSKDDEAARWWKKGAELGDADCQYNYAEHVYGTAEGMLSSSSDVPKVQDKRREAFRWFYQAAARGNASAQSRITSLATYTPVSRYIRPLP